MNEALRNSRKGEQTSGDPLVSYPIINLGPTTSHVLPKPNHQALQLSSFFSIHKGKNTRVLSWHLFELGIPKHGHFGLITAARFFRRSCLVRLCLWFELVSPFAYDLIIRHAWCVWYSYIFLSLSLHTYIYTHTHSIRIKLKFY